MVKLWRNYSTTLDGVARSLYHPVVRTHRDTFESRLTDVAQGLGRCLGRMIEALPDSPSGPQQLAESLGVDKGFASRLLKAIRCRDPVALAYTIPGPEPLRRLVKAAGRRGVDRELAHAADAEIDRFAALIDTAGDRSTFDGIVGSLLPDARRQFENRTKQLLFRGNSQLRGFVVDVDFTIILMHPTGDGEHVDYVAITGVLGLQRLRPGAVVRLATWNLGPDMPVRLTTLDREPIECLSSGRLDAFCSAPAARLEIHRSGDTLTYTLADGPFGPGSEVDFVLGQWSHAPAPLFSPPSGVRLSGVGAEVDKPARLLHLDVLAHEEVYPGADPRLFLIDTAFRGMANINDPAREADYVPLMESVRPLPGNVTEARPAFLPGYGDLLRYVEGKTNWRLSRFRGYRCTIEYPLYGMQVTLGFPRPMPRG